MKILYALSIIVILNSCQIETVSNLFLSRNYEKNIELSQSIGNPIIQIKFEERSKSGSSLNNSWYYELLYSGKSGNVIRLLYREYSNDYIRPAFTQDVQYDLSETKRIRFKHTVIDIVEATNMEIKYKVIDSPDLTFRQGKISNYEREKILSGKVDEITNSSANNYSERNGIQNSNSKSPNGSESYFKIALLSDVPQKIYNDKVTLLYVGKEWGKSMLSLQGKWGLSERSDGPYNLFEVTISKSAAYYIQLDEMIVYKISVLQEVYGKLTMEFVRVY